MRVFWILLLSAMASAGPRVSPQAACERAQGNSIGTRCFCESRQAFFDPADSSQADACAAAQGQSLVKSVTEVQDQSQMNATCLACGQTAAPPACPQALIQASKEDTQSSFWRDLVGLQTPDENCRHVVTPAAQKLPAEK